MDKEPQESLIKDNPDPLIRALNRVVVWSVKCLAVLMVLVILWALVDVFVHVFLQLTEAPAARFDVDRLIKTLGAFLAMLIAIEIFLNIVFYLKRDAIHVPLVLATALTAAARKVIILDYSTITPEYILATAAAILAVGVTYWLITKKS